MNHLFILIVAGGCFSIAYNMEIVGTRAAVGSCMMTGDRIPDSENITIYYFCFQNPDGSWMLIPDTCAPYGYWNTTVSECLIYDEDMTTTTEETSSAATTESPVGTSPDETAPPSVTTTTTETTDSSSAGTSSTESVSSTATPPDTCSTPNSGCTVAGRFSDNSDCGKYYICILRPGSANEWLRYEYACASNYYFNSGTELCSLGPCPYTMNPCPTTTIAPIDQNSTTTTPPTPPPTTITSTSGPTNPPVGFICEIEGIFPHPSKCTQYYQCLMISGTWYYWVFECPPGSHYDPMIKSCALGDC